MFKSCILSLLRVLVLRLELSNPSLEIVDLLVLQGVIVFKVLDKLIRLGVVVLEIALQVFDFLLMLEGEIAHLVVVLVLKKLVALIEFVLFLDDPTIKTVPFNFIEIF